MTPDVSWQDIICVVASRWKLNMGIFQMILSCHQRNSKATVLEQTWAMTPLQAYDFPEVFVGISCMVPLKFLYHGCMGTSKSPSSKRRRLATISLGLKFGINVLHPVPMPSAPFTSTMGMTGIYLLKKMAYFARQPRRGIKLMINRSDCHAGLQHSGVM